MHLERRSGRNVRELAASSTTCRRFAGHEADELAIVCRPECGTVTTAEQAGTVYRALGRLLTANRASFRHLTGEMLFLRDVRRDLPVVLGVRANVLAELAQSSDAPLPAFIGQAPLGDGASFELSASAVVPRHADTWSARDVPAMPSCACEGCAMSGARLVCLGDQVSLHTASVYGAGRDAFEQVSSMLLEAERLLRRCGMEFRDVLRTWIYLRDIDRDYDALNAARREFFQARGIGLRPASTGVQGGPFPDGHDICVRLLATKSPRGLDITRMSTPTLNEAWSYGADFSRGLRFADANKVTLHISGTASIDEAGRTVHVGDLEAQAGRMLGNIESLLAQQGASFANLMSVVTYVKNPGDAAVLYSIYRERGFDGFPCTMVAAPLCRPELLCETEAVAALPLAMAGA